MIDGYYNCDVMTVFLSALWVFVGALVAGPVCYAIGRNRMAKEIYADVTREIGAAETDERVL